MPSPADDQLLFGLLALQIGLIDQSQLVAAFQAWTLDRARSLADHLKARGDLDGEQCTLLEALAAQHKKKHGGDTEESLASISAGKSTLELLASIAGLKLDGILSTIAPTPPDPDRVGGYPFGTATSDGQRFRVVRPHARGGLGAVFVALDSELNREVALKQILDNHADDPVSRSRFLVEAEITGGLEHPGIVPVYGLGTYGDGRPYYAMRFIRGDSLKEAIVAYHGGSKGTTARLLEFRRLLKRFTDVCDAIDYAHSRGVLHRDIKPANVIVGKHGETLVIDWGLAKAMGRSTPESAERTLLPSSSSGSSETLPGQAMGTPAYMSPEQARGDLDALGPRSDVYSLGATLYCLLTGSAPFDGQPAVVLKKVEHGVLRRPRDRDPSIDPALEAIVLKAMAKPPADRYASCRALADDIDRWLAGERVVAYREPWTRGLNRWLSKHRTAVTGTAAAGLMLMAGMASVAAVQTRARHELDFKNGQLTETNSALEGQRNRAEEREGLAIDAVKRFRDAVVENPELKDNPSLESLRKALLKGPLAFFGKLRERLQTDQDTRPESLARLAGVIHDYTHLARDLGDPGDGLKAHEDSQAIWERLVHDAPDREKYQSSLASVLYCRGTLLRKQGRNAEALATHEQAGAIRTRLTKEHPDVIEYWEDLADVHNNIGVLLSDEGRNADALKSHERALAIRERLPRDHPDAVRYQSSLANSHGNIGLLLKAEGRNAEALAAHERARAIWARLLGDHPGAEQHQNALADTHESIGVLLNNAGRDVEALDALEQARAIRARLVKDHPNVLDYQAKLANGDDNLGGLLDYAGRLADAAEAYRRAGAIHEQLAEEHPEVLAYRVKLAGSEYGVGFALSDAGRHSQALEAYKRAWAIWARLVDEHPEALDYRAKLADSEYGIGFSLNGLGRKAEALEAYRRLRATWARLVEEHPGVLDYRAKLANGDYCLGVVLNDEGHHADALEAYERARTIHAQLAEEHPDVADYQTSLASDLNNIGILQRSMGRSDEALEAYHQVRVIYARLSENHPESPDYSSNVGAALNDIATIHVSNDRWNEARRLLIEAAIWQRKALAARPGEPRYRRNLLNHLSNGIKVAQHLELDEAAAEIARELAEFRASDPKFASLDARLAAILGGEGAKDNAERLDLAQRAYDIERYAQAAQLWGEAVETDPGVAESRDPQHRYNAACAAVLSSSGQGVDPPADEDAKAKLRAKALAWLRSERDAWAKIFESGDAQAKEVVSQNLRHWRKDTDLAGVRDDEPLEKLSEEERASWRSLWEGVDELLHRATSP